MCGQLGAPATSKQFEKAVHATFIQTAEHMGLMKPLTLLILRKAARQCRAWAIDQPDMTVAVNISAANLLDIHLVDHILDVLHEEHLNPEQLVLEVTESVMMTDPDRARSTLTQLADVGIKIAIDDYGTGHASLTSLQHLPVSELKIDRSFIRHLASNATDQAIVRSTIDLGHSLGLSVVAEGVEDAAALAILTSLGCDSVQGFHLCRPRPRRDGDRPPHCPARTSADAPLEEQTEAGRRLRLASRRREPPDDAFRLPNS